VLPVAVAVYRSRAAPAIAATALTGLAVMADPHAAALADRPRVLVLDAVVLLSTCLITSLLAAARRPPAASLGVALAADAVLWVSGRSSWAVIAVSLLALGACPVLLPRAASVAALAAAEALVAGAASGLYKTAAMPPADVAAIALGVVLAWGAGESVSARRRSAAREAAAARQVMALRESGARARERTAIARELHDVVAHHVSMIAVRAATAPYSISDLPGPAREVFGEIALEARTALDQLRAVLGVLRTPEVAGSHRPQPRLTDLPSLLDRMRGTGMEVTLAIAGAARALPEPVELCAYRIVQEALTNSARHAPGSRVSVALDYRPDALTVVVRDDGRGGGLAGRHAPGFGLAGLRERAAMLGGDFEACTVREGGFRIAARLPVLAPLSGAAGN
jgi:signal transduction histidine kinase